MIVILGILAAIVVFAVGGISDRGKQSACKADQKSTQTAVEATTQRPSNYPAALSDLKPLYASRPAAEARPVTAGTRLLHQRRHHGDAGTHRR